jgi:branched-chain amino acid aminotransferase
MTERARVWINGRLASADQACIPVFDHGLLYGDGVFEGIRFYHGRPFRLAAHLKRLQQSAAALRIPVPYGLEEIEQAVWQTIRAFDRDSGYLRLLVTRGQGPLGLDADACGRPNVIVIADHMALVSDTQRLRGVRAMVAATRRLPADGLDPRIKSLNYLNHILARMEARQAGADEAILLNHNGHVAEGSADNVFVVRDRTLLTPPCSDGALDGITRAVVLQLAAAAGHITREAHLGTYDLYTADECFLTGTGAELIPVCAVDGRPLGSCPGPVFQDLQQRYRDVINLECGENGR